MPYFAFSTGERSYQFLWEAMLKQTPIVDQVLIQIYSVIRSNLRSF